MEALCFAVFSASGLVALYALTCRLISASGPLFLAAGLKGKDYGRKSEPLIPEGVGVIAAAGYLACLSITLFLPHSTILLTSSKSYLYHVGLSSMLAGTLSISSMAMLGFVDDVLNLRWRVKLLLPLISSIPLVLVYAMEGGSTRVLVFFPFKSVIGPSVDLGILYYVYMLLLGVFCTNSVNILAGINGLEVGQSLVIGVTLCCFALMEIVLGNMKAYVILYFILPFLAVSLAMLRFNWYPALVFVGDTYCYFTGMTFAVVGILGHCSKTLLIFFLPQILNFLFSLPQLFHMLPCPRHRLPKFNQDTGLREPSSFSVPISSLSLTSCALVGLLARVGLAKVDRAGHQRTHVAEVDNMTIINAYLRIWGPTHERDLAITLLEFQVACNFTALFFRYALSWLFFGL